MPERLYRIMHQFVSERFLSSRVLELLKNSSASHLIELSGRAGSGKSYLISPLVEQLKVKYERVRVFSPNPMSFNQFEEIVELVTDLETQQLKELIQEHQSRYRTGRKHDFFYFLTSRLNELEMLKPMVLIVDDCDVLDSFSREFLLSGPLCRGSRHPDHRHSRKPPFPLRYLNTSLSHDRRSAANPRWLSRTSSWVT